MLGGVCIGGCPRICLGRAPWGLGSQGTHPPPALGMERGAEGMHTWGVEGMHDKCVPSCTSSVLELSHQHGLISPVLYTTFCQSSAAKGQNPATTYWLCELSKKPVGALSQWHPTSSPSFSLSPHPVCGIPTNACLGHTHTLGLSLTVTSLSCSSLNYVRFSQGTVLRAGHSFQACIRLPAYPRNLLALGQALRYLNCSGRLLRFKEMVLSQSQDQRRGSAVGAPRPSGRPLTWLISRYASRS